MSKIIVVNKKQIIFDDKWADLFSLTNRIKIDGRGYASVVKRRRIVGRLYSRSEKCHRIIMGALPGQYVDHIDGNRLNNKENNLRICTNQENSRNRKKTNKKCYSSFKGVTFAKDKRKWKASIVIDYKYYHLSYCDSEEEASEIYNIYAMEIFGSFALLN